MADAANQIQRPLGRALQRLDHAPWWLALLLGAAVGAIAVAALWPAGSMWRLLGGGVLLCAVPALVRTSGWIGEPVAPPAPTLLDMVRLEGGKFWMGSADDDEEAYGDEQPRWLASVEGPLWVQRCPVTNAEYRRIVPEHAPGEPDELPVTDVSWVDAIHFCNALSAEAGLAPAYAIGDAEVRHDPAAEGYRLPTEVEWEYACRAGTQTRYSFGDDPRELGDHAWFDENSEYRKHPVGEKRANPWGLHDLHGNVREWCWDEGESYPLSNVDLLTKSAGLCVLRGGSFFDVARNLRSAFRFRDWPESRGRLSGFRCVRVARREL